ncbi:hypothetical protein Tco_1246441, partial [Tanacetum coccineum]
MLDSTRLESWQQPFVCIVPGKDKGRTLRKSITEGPQNVLESFTTFLLKKRKGNKAHEIRATNIYFQHENVHNQRHPQEFRLLQRQDATYDMLMRMVLDAFDTDIDESSHHTDHVHSNVETTRHFVQSNDSSIRNDALMSILDEMHEQWCTRVKNGSLRAEIEKVKQHYKEMFESIKITRTSTNAKTSSLLTQIEDLKAQLEGNLKVATRSSVKPKVLVPGMYAMDVKPIPHPLKNNMSAYLNYTSHLKESVETVREIVEEARVVKPLDNTFNYACQYTKLSQELLEYMIGTCPKGFNERDNKAPSTPVTRKKQVTHSDKPRTSSSNTQKHEVHQKVQQTNIPVIPSTGVNTSTEASGSKPRSNTKKNRILPAK